MNKKVTVHNTNDQLSVIVTCECETISLSPARIGYNFLSCYHCKRLCTVKIISKETFTESGYPFDKIEVLNVKT